MHVEEIIADAEGREVGLRIDRRRVVRVLGGLATLGVAVHLAALTLRPWSDSGVENASWLLLTEENTPATWLSSMLLAAAAALALWCALAARTDRRWWVALAGLLAFFSVDETASVHERLARVLLPDLDGVLNYSWIVLGAAAVLFVSVTSIGFLWRLPRATRRQIIVAGVVFVAGGLLVEGVAGWYVGDHGEGAVYYLISTVEEALELAGAVLFSAAFVAHAHRTGVSLRIHTATEGPAAAALEDRESTSTRG